MSIAPKLGLGLLCLSVLSTISVSAQAEEEKYGDWSADLRFRYEAVEQDNVLKDARANTLRLRLGFISQSWKDLTFGIHGEVVTALGSERYNSGPGGNGNTNFSVIPDPEGEEVNQLWVAYKGLADTTLKLGRQRLIFDNARFIGNVGWRQNEQTYDGLVVSNNSIENTNIQYAFLTEVHDIFGRDSALDKANLLNIAYEYSPNNRIVGYGYYLDYEPGMGSDQGTIGIRADGQLFKAESVTGRYKLEYAQQSDYADAAINYDLDYSLIELALAWKAFDFKAGIETLEGNGVSAFTTPLATLHAFNGWADQFLSTPKAGLVDRYVGTGAKINGVKLQLVYHDFVSDVGNVDHGQEWNASIGITPLPGMGLLLKYADYSADATSVDTEKLWLQLAYAF